jgi:hypothetical protein
MTEDTWLAGSDPQPMLEFLGSKASDRKLRLLAVACFDHLHRQAGDENDRAVIELGERYADVVRPAASGATECPGNVLPRLQGRRLLRPGAERAGAGELRHEERQDPPQDQDSASSAGRGA